MGSSDGLRRGMKVQHRCRHLCTGRYGHPRSHHGRAGSPD
jgi:hypothetical protein